MKKIIFVVSTLMIFALFNYAIFKKEKIKANGETVFLKLAPVDPRSLIQGDYMQLRYDIERSQSYAENAMRGYMVVALDTDKVGTFKRFYEGEKLDPNEKLLRYHNQFGRLQIVPDSYMLQEGDAALYSHAKYGIFRFDTNGDHILVGLADEKLQVIRSVNAKSF